MQEKCLTHGIFCIKFAIDSKVKNKIGTEKLIAVDNDIEIKPISAKYFFCIARKKDHEGYI